MSERRHVTRRPDGKWQEKPEGASRAGSVTQTQSEAAANARDKLQRTPGGGEVVIHGRDGKIRDADTINRRDPFPPRDSKH